ncbi:hypothetical protein ACWA1F_04860 [Flavobacterium sp. 3-218]
MSEQNVFTDLTITSKNNIRLNKYFDSIKRDLPESWSWLRDKTYEDNKSFFLIENTICLKTPYYKNKQHDLIYYGILSLALTDQNIILLDIEILNLVNNENLSSIYSAHELIHIKSIYLNLFVNSILKQNKLYENFNHVLEYGGHLDENSFKNDIRDERMIKLHDKERDKIYFLNKGKEAKHSDKRIVYYTPNNISLSLSLMKKSYKKSKKHLKVLLGTHEQKLIKLKEKDKVDLYEYFESITTSVIFAYIAVESFANASIPNDFIYERVNEKQVKELWTKENIERWFSTSQKISEILPIFLKTENIKNQSFWPQFKKLEQIRNQIVHQKTIEDGTQLNSDLYDRLLENDIFRIIGSSVSIIKFFYDYDNAHPYFPLGLGVAKFQIKEISSIQHELGALTEVE